MPYHSLEDPAKLRRVVEAVLLLEADLDLPSLLRHIVEEARSMTNARYGALGVLNQDGTALSEFITAGMDAAGLRSGDRAGGFASGQVMARFDFLLRMRVRAW